MEIGLERSELRAKHLREQLSKLDGQPLKKYLAARAMENVSEGAMVAVTAAKTNKILDIGFNVAEDLILDNFGFFLAGLIRTPINAQTTFVMVDVTGANMTFGVGGTYPFCHTNSIYGTWLQVGTGTTPAARGDYIIETAFGTAPENARFGSSPGGYGAGSGSLSFSGAVSAGGSGTVNEQGFFMQGFNTSQQNKIVMWFHDILGSGVAFVAGNTINASYGVTL